MSPELNLLLARDSVCMFDDIDAPHKKLTSISQKATLEELTKTIIRSKYLPTIQGGKATWVLKFGNKPVAVIAQEWREAKFLVDKDIFICEFTNAEQSIDFYLSYLVQKNPTEIFDSLRK